MRLATLKAESRTTYRTSFELRVRFSALPAENRTTKKFSTSRAFFSAPFLLGSVSFPSSLPLVLNLNHKLVLGRGWKDVDECAAGHLFLARSINVYRKVGGGSARQQDV